MEKKSAFTPEEKELYSLCVQEFKDAYPNLQIDMLWIQDEYNSNRDPNMRTFEQITVNHKPSNY
jgi:DNA replication initiation complex subunit (GINS family)